MQWLNKIVDEAISRSPEGEVLIESGGSPSGVHHLGHLRELITSDAVILELKKRGRQARHVYFADDLDALRKIPVNIPTDYKQYLGKPLCDIPAPEEAGKSYAEYFLQNLLNSAEALGMEIEFIRSHEKYRAGFFTEAIEKALENTDQVRSVLENISGHKLGDEWSPVQINEDGYLKKRKFISIDKNAKTIVYEDKDGNNQTVNYERGDIKLDWRIDWPARWWLLGVDVEPFGRDHATKGGSYDTGAELCRKIFGVEPPLSVPYDFVNLAGDTKKMSASKGTGLDAESVISVLPPEIIRFLMLRYPPSKRLYFDPNNGVSQLIDEFAELLDKPSKTPEEEQLVWLCRINLNPVISRIPFTHLVVSYQAALKDPAGTIEIIKRTHPEYGTDQNVQIIQDELKYIDRWLEEWAPDDVKFSLREDVKPDEFSDTDKEFLKELSQKIEQAPATADGEWFHKAIYELKEQTNLSPQQAFVPLYKALIGKTSGPRAGWFLSILSRDWLVKRLQLEG